ncbi:hypothetical protein DEU35_2574 [Microbacterium sp. AG157]|nr:hypothetical protein DEU35_2574 [Microbacterium sp. AG157]
MTDVAIETAYPAGGDLGANRVNLLRNWPQCVWIH